MLLTLKPPAHSEISRSPHVPSPPLSSRSGLHHHHPDAAGGTLPPLPDTGSNKMSAGHRGLPPPLGMTLAERERAAPPPPPSLAQSMGSLPAPPNQWQGSDDAMRNWLMAKAEEDKRKQEEEKTRQENLRLEQRRIEQAMLRESLQGGVPPPMVPIVFAGLGGNALASTSLEWAQHYMAQITIQQQQMQQQQQQQPQQSAQSLPPAQGSPDNRRDRTITGPNPNPYGTQQPLGSNQSGSTYQSGYPMPGAGPRGSIPSVPPTSNPRMPGQSTLSRLNTGEMQTQPAGPMGLQLGHHGLQQAQVTQQQEQQSSPSIYFHHWQPPSAQKEQSSSATKSQHNSPYSQSAGSHLRSEYAHSPKKRKTTNASGTGPTGKSPDTSPRTSQAVPARRRAHSNQRSDASSRGTYEALGQSGSRPQSRHRQASTSEGESGSQRHSSIQPETRQSRESADMAEKNRHRSGTPKREAEGPPG